MIATLPWILRHARRQRGKLALVVALSLLDMGLTAQFSLSFKFLIDHAIREKNETALYWIAGALCISIATVAFTGFWRDKLYAAVTGEMVATLRRACSLICRNCRWRSTRGRLRGRSFRDSRTIWWRSKGPS